MLGESEDIDEIFNLIHHCILLNQWLVSYIQLYSLMLQYDIRLKPDIRLTSFI